MEELSPNHVLLERMARRIRPLLDEVVFVGGQIVELLLTDPAATRIRATTDVDVVVTASTRSEYRQVERRLAALGFENDQREGAPICRWRNASGDILDVMPVDAAILGFSNEWYPAAVAGAEEYQLHQDLVIRIPTPGVFLATKLAAYRSRGSDDILLSHDLEDIITLVAGRSEILDELRHGPEDLRVWVVKAMRNLLTEADFSYALQGALPDAARLPGYRQTVRARFEAIAALT
ncbi:MAG TPA: hypothetical protein VK966_05765 [Longimicrobiales bacterium]|nr:hypothetical protein [Longimicrobiales bacterium]